MKKTVTVISALIMATAGCTSVPAGYVVQGTIAGMDTGKIILTNESSLYPLSDTAELKGGKFTFTGTVTSPENVSLYVNGGEDGAITLFLVNGVITVEGDIAALPEAKITGPQVVMDAQALLRLGDSLVNAARPSYPPDFFDLLEDEQAPAKLKAERQALYEQALEQIMAAGEKTRELYKAYARKNPYSPLTVWFIANSITTHSLDELASLSDSLQQQPDLQGNRYLAQIVEYVTNARGIEVGKIVPDFTQAAPDGAPLTFSSVYKKNKLTMIDFWASWCGPCRRFNPALVKIYNRYHAKGFEIVAVSCDKKKDEWLKAIAGDNLTWYHVSDLQGWNNAVAKQFNILSIPQNVFVDADGVIVAKQVDEEALENFLKKQLN
ncbi:MAG: AhpC/TSA family protein [Prevotellaceae bacterium]|jgi:thiol-disulfide isomerase/thioredoxin|nr:AhpC/TSA family protein [Prevotellaceae bacterium]